MLSRECARLLEGGRILFIGSDAAINPRVGAAAYSIAQAASDALRRALRAEWADRDIAVGSFKPGLVDTPMGQGFMELSAAEFPARTSALRVSDEIRSRGVRRNLIARVCKAVAMRFWRRCRTEISPTDGLSADWRTVRGRVRRADVITRTPLDMSAGTAAART